MGKLNERKAALAKKLEAVKDISVLDAVEDALTGGAAPALSDAEYAELSALKAGYLRGEEEGVPWSEVKARLRRMLRS